MSDTVESLVKVDTTIGLEEVAAIKVAQVERECLMRQEELRAGLKQAEAHVQKLESGLQSAVIEDTRDEHPEIAKLESAMKSFFGKDAIAKISVTNEGKVQIGLSGHCVLQLKGTKSKAIKKEIETTRKDIVEAENDLCTVKKNLGMLPHLERSAKAAVAKARLEQSSEGRNLLAQIDKISLPALPAPKK